MKPWEKFIKDQKGMKRLKDLFNVPKDYKPEPAPPARDDVNRTQFLDDLKTGEELNPFGYGEKPLD
jgi:hypothetical protein